MLLLDMGSLEAITPIETPMKNKHNEKYDRYGGRHRDA